MATEVQLHGEFLIATDLTHNDTLPAGAAVDAAPGLLVSSATFGGVCAASGDTLTFATTCQRDQQDRPVT